MCVNRHALHCYCLHLTLEILKKQNKVQNIHLATAKTSQGDNFYPPTHLKRHFDVLRGNLNMDAAAYKHRHFENTKLLAGNDYVIDIFTSEDMENILLYIFSILLSTI